MTVVGSCRVWRGTGQHWRLLLEGAVQLVWGACGGGELAGAAGVGTYYVLVGLIEENGVVGLAGGVSGACGGGIARRTGILAVVGCWR